MLIGNIIKHFSWNLLGRWQIDRCQIAWQQKFYKTLFEFSFSFWKSIFQQQATKPTLDCLDNIYISEIGSMVFTFIICRYFSWFFSCLFFIGYTTKTNLWYCGSFNWLVTRFGCFYWYFHSLQTKVSYNQSTCFLFFITGILSFYTNNINNLCVISKGPIWNMLLQNISKITLNRTFGEIAHFLLERL